MPPVRLRSLLLVCLFAVTACSTEQTAQDGASASVPPSSEETEQASAEPTSEAGGTAAADDPLSAFLATDAGAHYADTVTGIEELGGTGGGIRVHRIDTDLTDPDEAVELCRAYQAAMATGQEQINVLNAEEMFLAVTDGDPETCVSEGTVLETAPPAPGPTQTPDGGPVVPAPDPEAPFTYEEAYAAWRDGMPYYEAFCVNYTSVTDGGVAQCEGISAGTVGYTAGEYLGP